MKKTLKIFVTVLVISLAICSFAFITSANETAQPGPNVVSANISYEGDYAILLAVDSASVKGGKVTVEVWKNGVKLDETFEDTTTETIKALDATLTKTYYVVKTPGVAQKDMDKEFTYKVTDGEGNFTEGKISVAEYFYIRLFDNGIINATEADEADFVRRDFYLDTLEQAAKAQNLLYNYNDNANDDISIFVTDLLYANIPGFDKALVDNNTTKVTLPGTGNYTVTKYAKDTFAKTETVVAAGTEITIDAHTVAVASEAEKPFVEGAGKYYNDKNIGGRKFDFSSSANLDIGTDAQWGPIVPPDTVSIATGKLVITRNNEAGTAGESYAKFIHTGFTGGENTPVFVYETDFMFDGYKANAATDDKKFGRFDFRLGGTKMVEIPITADYTVGEEIATVKFGEMELNAGQWYNIRFEYDVTTDVVTFYRNDVNVGTKTYTTKANTNTSRNWSCWYFESELTAGTINFDNTIIACYDENPPVGGDFYRSDNEGIRYNDNDLLAELDGKPAENVNASAVMEDGKLAFNQNGASGPAIRWEHGLSAEGLTTPVFVYEADMSFDFTGSVSTAGYIKFYANGVYCFVELQYWQDSMYIKCGSTITLNRGQEYNVRFEVDYENSTIKCFIDGVLKGTNTFTPQSNSSTHVTIEYMRTNVSTGKITVDNLYMGMVEDGTAE